ncbi:MAG: MerR family DNA-binding transcriptional regulator [Hyphomicrobiales bacterium]|nr:MerR family DNA-binding transcriptional regulator [Hyphomicrobiales bacterium]MCP5373660.1 MerR family DNA-binding transcriptional regulator [Hyphomicrobiales bacterium]
MTKDFFSITELSDELGVSARALRFYEDKGLVTPQRAGTTRVYTRRDRARLILILRGKRLGFTLREVKEWLDLYDTDPDQIEQMSRLHNILHRKIVALELQRDDLEETLREMRAMDAQVMEHLRGKGANGSRPDAACAAPRTNGTRTKGVN